MQQVDAQKYFWTKVAEAFEMSPISFTFHRKISITHYLFFSSLLKDSILCIFAGCAKFFAREAEYQLCGEFFVGATKHEKFKSWQNVSSSGT